MDLSVVICTRNRANNLADMLASLRRLQAPGIAWELVLVDNNSSDGTLDILEAFRLESPVPTQVIHEPKNGLSNARNAGWKAARGEIISFTDDDCYPQEDWLVATMQAFKESNATYIGGRVLLFDPEDAPITIQTSAQRVDFPAHAHMESGEIIGANFSVRRKLFQAIGGFDSRLGAGTPFHSGEDTDFLIRASLAGFEGRYEPAIVVLHHHRRRLDTDIDKLYCGYAFGRGALSAKTILETQAKKLYFKNWYWRLRSLLKRGEYAYIFNEFKGAASFVLHRNRRAHPANDIAAPKTPQKAKPYFHDPDELPLADIDKHGGF